MEIGALFQFRGKIHQNWNSLQKYWLHWKGWWKINICHLITYRIVANMCQFDHLQMTFHSEAQDSSFVELWLRKWKRIKKQSWTRSNHSTNKFRSNKNVFRHKYHNFEAHFFMILCFSKDSNSIWFCNQSWAFSSPCNSYFAPLDFLFASLSLLMPSPSPSLFSFLFFLNTLTSAVS